MSNAAPADRSHQYAPPSPPGARARAIPPDLARGLMLLLIALANVSWFLYGPETALTNAHRVDPTPLEAVWQTIAIIAIDGRSYPLFAFLFGYGIWQLFSRQLASGRDERGARRLLQARNLWLIVFGAVDAALLWYGDVLGAYGLVGLVVVWLFLRRRTKTLVVWASVLTGLLLVGGLFSLASGFFVPPEYAETGVAVPNESANPDYVASIVGRLATWAFLTLMQGPLGLVVPIAILLGIAAARSRILEAPAEHRALLRRVALIGIPIGWVGALPALLAHQGTLAIASWAPGMLAQVTGLATGLGYAALFGLVSIPYAEGRAPGPVVNALTAVGKRSLSSYLLQSLLLAPLLCAWGLGLGGVLEQWQGALVAVVVWLVSIAVAVALERAGRRGPAEWLLRRLAYGRSRSVATPIRG